MSTRHSAIGRVVTAVLLALAVPCLPAAAQSATPDRLQDYAVTTWNENDGLRAARIMTLQQDRDGYLWLGTDGGLVRFDGVHFEPVVEVGGTKLPVAPISTLLAARDGSLWMGVLSTVGVMRIQRGKLTTFHADQGLPGGLAMAVLEDRRNTIWVGNTQGLFQFDGTRFHQVTGQPGLVGAAVLTLLESKDGRLWAATRSGVFCRDREGEPFQQVDEIEISSNVWQGLSEAADGSIWISDLERGFRQVGATVAHPHLGWGTQLLHDTRGNLWVATRGEGLWRVRGHGSTRKAPVDVLTMRDGLASDAVQSVLEDREGNIWLGTYAGLQRLTPHRVTPITNVPLARAAAVTRDGSVWIGGTSGLTRFSPAGVRRYGSRDGLGSPLVLALYADDGGTLWVTTARGLLRFENETFTRVVSVSPGSVARIFSIARTGSGLWLGDVNRRLFRASDTGRVMPSTAVPQAFQEGVVSLASDSRGDLWIGSTDGRLGVLRANGTFESHTLGIGNIRALYESRDGTLWAGGDEGLSIVNGQRVRTLTEAHGLPRTVRSIVEDNQGVMWVGVATAIARIERAEMEQALATPGHIMQIRLFNTADGTAGVPVNDGSPSAVRGNDGRLWFATSAGVTVVDPLRIGERRRITTPVIEGITADTTRMEPVQDLTLPAGVSQVQLSFRALALTDSMRAQFKYRLDGIDREWVDGGTVGHAVYTNLAPGPYTFRVMAANADGVWGDARVLQFSVAPTFFQTRSFYALCALMLCSLVYLSWRLHTRHVRRQFELVLAERIRMSRAIHDTLLQGLAGLALQLDDLVHGLERSAPPTSDRLRSIRRRVEEYIREARQSIWDLRSPVLERRSFPDALREVGYRAIAERPVTLDVNVKGAPQPYSPVVEQQLLLICQEALTNAVRHGQPRSVDVELEYGADNVRVRVSDDGCGFDPSTLEKVNGHYGVVSMRERAAQVRGRFTIASTPGKGTQVETVVPAS